MCQPCQTLKPSAKAFRPNLPTPLMSRRFYAPDRDKNDFLSLCFRISHLAKISWYALISLISNASIRSIKNSLSSCRQNELTKCFFNLYLSSNISERFMKSYLTDNFAGLLSSKAKCWYKLFANVFIAKSEAYVWICRIMECILLNLWEIKIDQ